MLYAFHEAAYYSAIPLRLAADAAQRGDSRPIHPLRVVFAVADAAPGGQLHEGPEAGVAVSTGEPGSHEDRLLAGEGLQGIDDVHPAGQQRVLDAQQQMLHGLEDLIQTVSLHGHTVGNVHDAAINTDYQMGNLFT